MKKTPSGSQESRKLRKEKSQGAFRSLPIRTVADVQEETAMKQMIYETRLSVPFRLAAASVVLSIVIMGLILARRPPAEGEEERPPATWEKLAPHFRPPPDLAGDLGEFRSLLSFDDGRKVESAADWKARRQEILRYWRSVIGEWPPLLEKPALEVLEEKPREDFAQTLVSGGAEDRPERWKALNHVVAVNRLLGFENRVAMTSRSGHSPTEESNEVLFLFFEHALTRGRRPSN
jgi:hypothetical protein